MSTPPAASSVPSSGPSVRPRQRFSTNVRNFWQRVSEGRQIEDLWTQFAADARASYGFYNTDVDWDEIKKLPRRHRPFRVAKEFFWALLLKLTPARRVLLLAAVVVLIVCLKAESKYEFLSAVVFLLLLSLELADKVTMKRDLEIAREIQAWLVPSAPPEIPGAEVAFASRPQNSVAGDYYDAFFATTAGADGGKLTLVIADVAGKSIPAALLMATLQASLRTIAGEGASLADLVMRLNRYACAHSLDGRRFTTAVLAEYEPATRRLSYVNAPGPRIYLLRQICSLATL